MVYVIDAKSDMRNMLDARNELGRTIAALAKREMEIVWFHDIKEPVAGAPQIFLECSDRFIDKVRALPGVARLDIYTGPFETERRPEIYAFFNSGVARKPAPKP